MECEAGVTRSIIDEPHSSDIQGDQMEGESDDTRSIIDELHSPDVQGNQMEGESGVTCSIIDELHFLGYPRRSNGRRKWYCSKCH